MKKCSKCAEDVRAEATVCKHCGHKFESVAKGCTQYGCGALIATGVVVVMIGWCAGAPSDRLSRSNSQRPAPSSADIASSPSRKVLRSTEPAAQQLANDLITQMRQVGLQVDCQKAEARVPMFLWDTQSADDRRLLTAAAARYCNLTSRGAFQIRHPDTGKVLAAIGTLDVELK